MFNVTEAVQIETEPFDSVFYALDFLFWSFGESATVLQLIWFLRRYSIKMLNGFSTEKVIQVEILEQGLLRVDHSES
jgi:hypothetical protein